MSEEAAKFTVEVLAKNFKRNFPAEGMKQIWKELCAQPDKAISDAADQICLNCSYLPSPAQLMERVKSEAKKIAADETRKREREWAETKGGETRKELERRGSIFSREQSDAHGKHAVLAIKLMMNPAASKKDKLDCFREMEKSYPGVGWGTEGAKLQRFYEGRVLR